LRRFHAVVLADVDGVAEPHAHHGAGAGVALLAHQQAVQPLQQHPVVAHAGQRVRARQRAHACLVVALFAAAQVQRQQQQRDFQRRADLRAVLRGRAQGIRPCVRRMGKMEPTVRQTMAASTQIPTRGRRQAYQPATAR
jgi:hypothetical protein